MRVISGIYKRRRFDVPNSFKARPTTDFAKENLFNVLSNNYFDFEDGVTALDLFAGTGSISIELVSRGCDKVISVEKDPQHLSFISQVMREVKTDKCFPVRADAFKFIEKCSEQFDFIFADPPYALNGRFIHCFLCNRKASFWSFKKISFRISAEVRSYIKALTSKLCSKLRKSILVEPTVERVSSLTINLE